MEKNRFLCNKDIPLKKDVQKMQNGSATAIKTPRGETKEGNPSPTQ